MLQSSGGQFFFTIVPLNVIQSLMGLLSAPVLVPFIWQCDQHLSCFGYKPQQTREMH